MYVCNNKPLFFGHDTRPYVDAHSIQLKMKLKLIFAFAKFFFANANERTNQPKNKQTNGQKIQKRNSKKDVKHKDHLPA